MPIEILTEEQKRHLLKKNGFGKASQDSASPALHYPEIKEEKRFSSNSPLSSTKDSVGVVMGSPSTESPVLSTEEPIPGPKAQEQTTLKTNDQTLSADIGFTEDELKIYLSPSEEYKPLAFEDPIEMWGFFDKNIQSGIVNWYSWQAEVNCFLARRFTKQSPLRFLLPACNGSGKDAYVNSVLSLFLCLCRIRSRTVITSASYTQLKNQTENYIRTGAALINKICLEQNIYPEAPFIIKKEHIVCRYTRSEIVMFTTDDPGRAEGYHPFPDYPNGEVTIIVNEAKTVTDEIYEHLSRCTFCRMILVSSPGRTAGFFYNFFRKARDWKDGYVPGKWYSRVISAYECPEHISKELIEAEKEELGENHPLFRSKRLALFTSLNEQVVITLEQVDHCIDKSKKGEIDFRKLPFYKRRGGLDIAKGGDENVLTVVEGNKVIAQEFFVATDFEEVTGPVILELCKKWEILEEDIYADDGGVGSGLIDWLIKRGLKVHRVMNQSVPTIAARGFQFGNRGAQNWFLFATLVQKCLIDISILEYNQKCRDQLGSRYYKQHETQGKLILESKKEARGQGHGSPDRADSLVLAFCGLTMHDFIDAPVVVQKRSGIMNQNALVKYMEEKKWTEFRKEQETKGKGFTAKKTPSTVLRGIYA